MTKNIQLHPNIRLLSWFNFLLDLRLYTPILILYFTKVTGSFALGMSLFSAAQLSAAFFEVPTGVISDRIGRRKTVIVGSIAAACTTLLYAAGKTYGLLLIGALCEGLSRALFSGNNDALLHDSLRESGSEEEFAEYSGRTESLSQVAIAIVSAVGGVVAFYSYSLVMYLSVIPALAGIYVATQMIEPGATAEKDEGNIYSHMSQAIKLFWQNKKLRLLSLGSMIGYAQGEAGYQFRAAFFAMVWPVWAIGLVKGLGSVGAAASFWFAGRLIKRFGAFMMILISKGYSVITNVVACLFPNVWAPLVMSSNSLFFGSGYVASSALKQKEYSARERATMASLDSLGGSIMYGLFAVALGLIADRWSPAQGILIMQIFAFISLTITWFLYRKHRE